MVNEQRSPAGSRFRRSLTVLSLIVVFMVGAATFALMSHVPPRSSELAAASSTPSPRASPEEMNCDGSSLHQDWGGPPEAGGESPRAAIRYFSEGERYFNGIPVDEFIFSDPGKDGYVTAWHETEGTTDAVIGVVKIDGQWAVQDFTYFMEFDERYMDG